MKELNLFDIKKFKNKIKYNEPLSNHTYMKVGGIVPVLFCPEDKKDLIEFVKWANKRNLEIKVIGKGSNLLVADNIIDLVFLKLESEYFKKIELIGKTIKAGAGVYLSKLIELTVKKGLSGLEFFSLIPGTLGGAINNNISFKYKGKDYEFSKLLRQMEVMDGRTGIIERNFLDKVNFRYHWSDLSNKIIISAELELKFDEFHKTLERLRNIKKQRMEKQDYSRPSLGCIFKNPDNGKTAGEIIEKTGLKGKRIGQAAVSDKHANFILNYGQASSKDILDLIELIQHEVFKQANIWLNPEIEIISR